MIELGKSFGGHLLNNTNDMKNNNYTLFIEWIEEYKQQLKSAIESPNFFNMQSLSRRCWRRSLAQKPHENSEITDTFFP